MTDYSDMTREARNDFIKGLKERNAMPDGSVHVKIVSRKNHVGYWLLTVHLDAKAQTMPDQMLIDFCDGGPWNFGGTVERHVATVAGSLLAATVKVYTD